MAAPTLEELNAALAVDSHPKPSLVEINAALGELPHENWALGALAGAGDLIAQIPSGLAGLAGQVSNYVPLLTGGLGMGIANVLPNNSAAQKAVREDAYNDLNTFWNKSSPATQFFNSAAKSWAVKPETAEEAKTLNALNFIPSQLGRAVGNASATTGEVLGASPEAQGYLQEAGETMGSLAAGRALGELGTSVARPVLSRAATAAADKLWGTGKRPGQAPVKNTLPYQQTLDPSGNQKGGLGGHGNPLTYQEMMPYSSAKEGPGIYEFYPSIERVAGDSSNKLSLMSPAERSNLNVEAARLNHETANNMMLDKLQQDHPGIFPADLRNKIKQQLPEGARDTGNFYFTSKGEKTGSPGTVEQLLQYPIKALENIKSDYKSTVPFDAARMEPLFDKSLSNSPAVKAIRAMWGDNDALLSKDTVQLFDTTLRERDAKAQNAIKLIQGSLDRQSKTPMNHEQLADAVKTVQNARDEAFYFHYLYENAFSKMSGEGSAAAREGIKPQVDSWKVQWQKYDTLLDRLRLYDSTLSIKDKADSNLANIQSHEVTMGGKTFYPAEMKVGPLLTVLHALRDEVSKDYKYNQQLSKDGIKSRGEVADVKNTLYKQLQGNIETALKGTPNEGKYRQAQTSYGQLKAIQEAAGEGNLDIGKLQNVWARDRKGNQGYYAGSGLDKVVRYANASPETFVDPATGKYSTPMIPEHVAALSARNALLGRPVSTMAFGLTTPLRRALTKDINLKNQRQVGGVGNPYTLVPERMETIPQFGMRKAKGYAYKGAVAAGKKAIPTAAYLSALGSAGSNQDNQ